MNEETLRQFAIQFNQAVSALIEMEAMKAANTQREIEGNSLAYVEKDFMYLLDSYKLGYNNCVEKSRDF